jgi:hypothetical protein
LIGAGARCIEDTVTATSVPVERVRGGCGEAELGTSRPSTMCAELGEGSEGEAEASANAGLVRQGRPPLVPRSDAVPCTAPLYWAAVAHGSITVAA